MSQTVLITGCSSGIGKSTTKYFLDKGWNVIATMRSPEKESDLKPSDSCLMIKLDVTDNNTITEAIRSGVEKFGGIDVVVNNAGYGLLGPFETATIDEIETQFSTNVFGAMSVVREILPLFRKQKSGVIINVASIGGRIAFPYYSLYHSTKWAIEGWSESLQYELKNFGVSVKVIEPGPIKTDFYGRSMTTTLDKNSPYWESASKVMSSFNKRGSESADPILVAKTIYRAAVSKNYRLRYQTDLVGKLLLQLRWLLPDSLFHFISARISGL